MWFAFLLALSFQEGFLHIDLDEDVADEPRMSGMIVRVIDQPGSERVDIIPDEELHGKVEYPYRRSIFPAENFQIYREGEPATHYSLRDLKVGQTVNVYGWYGHQQVEIVDDPFEDFEFSLIQENWVLDTLPQDQLSNFFKKHTNHIVNMLGADCWHCREMAYFEVAAYPVIVWAYAARSKDPEIRDRANSLIMEYRQSLIPAVLEPKFFDYGDE